MDNNSWEMAVRVFAWGFSGVFAILVILLWCVQLMSAVIRGTRRPKPTSYKKGEK